MCIFFNISCFFKFLQALHESLYRVETGNYDYRYDFAFISTPVQTLKWTKHCPVLLDATCSIRLHTLLHVVACCWELLRKVWNQSNFWAYNSQHLFCSVIAKAYRNNVGSVCTALPTLFGPRTCITHGLQSLMGCILSMMHSGLNIVGSCCIRFPTTTNKDANAPNIVGKVHEWFFDSRTTALLVTNKTKIELTVGYCLLLFAIFIT